MNVCTLLTQDTTKRPRGNGNKLVRSACRSKFVFIVLRGYPRVVLLQYFLLKVVSENTEGGLTMSMSIPCETGASVEVCMVEVRIFCGI